MDLAGEATVQRHSLGPAAGDVWTGSLDERCLDELIAHSRVLRWPMISTTVVVAVLAAVQVPSAWALGWFVLTVVIREIRAAVLRGLAPPTNAPIARRLVTTVWWTLALGLAHGGAALFMLSLDTTFSAILTMILMSLSAGAVSTTFTVPRAFLAFSGAIALPIAAMWALRGDLLGPAVATLVVMFLLVQLRFARRSMDMFVESFNIRQENAQLVEQLDHERREIAQARDEAVRANRSKSQFLAAASHDLRQPLQSLALNGGVLVGLELDGETREIAHEIGAEIEALRQMLDALLDVSKLDAGGVQAELRVIRLDQFLAGLLGRHRAGALAKGLRIVCECEPGAQAVSDPDMLLRVMSNLVDNAIKFTAEGEVSITVARKDAEYEVRIADTGCGIPPAELERVFDDLVQLRNDARDRRQGHGLGLGIVRRITGLLGIRYRLESTFGSGSVFILGLPAYDGPAVTAAPGPAPGDESPPEAPPTLGARVLVLDDEDAVRKAYRRALSSMGCVVFDCATLADALDVARRHAPHAAVLDFRLEGGLDGLDALRLLRGIAPHLGAVLVSADASETLQARAEGASVALMRKPISGSALRGAVESLLQDRCGGLNAGARGSPKSIEQ